VLLIFVRTISKNHTIVKPKLRPLFSILLFALFSTYHICSARDPDSIADKSKSTANAYISWVSQYPSGTLHKKNRVLRKIVEIIIGEKRQRVLLRPISVIATDPGNFMILDQGSQTIFNVEDNDQKIPHCIKRKENYFTSLIGACALPGGEMLFTDSRLNKIYAISADRKKLRELNDTLKLQQPTGIAYSAVKNEIWVVETGAHRIKVLNTKGEVIKTIGERGEEEGQFNFPTSITIDRSGEVYVVDAMNFRIQLFNKDGSFISMFGEAGDASGFLGRPKGIATDTFGNIYVVDGIFHTVQIFDKAGNFLYTFGRQGREKEDFWMPNGIYIDDKNYIYVADTYNSRIQVFKLNNG
jgi:hypothetical protein